MPSGPYVLVLAAGPLADSAGGGEQTSILWQLLGYVQGAISALNTALWDFPSQMPLMVCALLATGLFLTVRLKLVNIRGFVHALRVVRGDYDNPADAGEISHFQALATALSATVGIGNIAGVATAIHRGGPGALFWMWVTALLGMTTKFTECTLATAFRQKHADGTVSGGPMYYIRDALGLPALAALFAICAMVSSFGQGNAVQAFTMADSFRDQFAAPTWLTGAFSAALVATVILGGIRRIGRVTGRLVPLMALIYFAAAVTVVVLNLTEIPQALALIIADAFRPTAAVGGFVGASMAYTLVWGVKRGLFSNEAGQGSAPIAHAAARTEEPAREGAVALLEPFTDTLVICTLTGLVIITTGVWSEQQPNEIALTHQNEVTLVHEDCQLLQNGGRSPDCELPAGTRVPVQGGVAEGVRWIVNHGWVAEPRVVTTAESGDAHEPRWASGILIVGDDGHPARLQRRDGVLDPAPRLTGRMLQDGSPLTAWAFDRGLAALVSEDWHVGGYLITLCAFLFAISTAISWSYYGDRCAEYLVGARAITPYRLLFVGMHFVGAIIPLKVVWMFGDSAIALMALPNLIALVALSGTAARLSRKYFARYRG